MVEAGGSAMLISTRFLDTKAARPAPTTLGGGRGLVYKFGREPVPALCREGPRGSICFLSARTTPAENLLCRHGLDPMYNGFKVQAVAPSPPW